MTTAADRVAAGAAFLDEHDPGWWRADVDRAIDLPRLYLGSACRCILGQLCPVEASDGDSGSDSRYAAYAALLSGLDPASSAVKNWASPLGFEADLDDDDMAQGEDYFALTAEWTRVIIERRAAA